MFNQPHSARAAVPWQPHGGLTQQLSRRGYAATSWKNDVPADFAELALPPKPSGFSAAHYQPTKQTLSQQAQASLALFEAEYRRPDVGDDTPASAQAPLDPNAHLPFVFDAYAATRKSKLRVQVDPAVLERAMAQAELAETLELSPITTDHVVAEPIVIHPDVSDVSDVSDGTLERGTQDEGDKPTLMAEADAQEAPAVPDLPMVAGGVSPEEVAQREAEHFAKGLAQAREEAAIELAQAVQRAREEALTQAREQAELALAQAVRQATEEATEAATAQGRVQGEEEGFARGLAQGQQEGHAQGLDEGKALGLVEGDAKARAALAEEMAAQRVVFEQAAQALQALMADSKQFFEPIKRLAMHIAEQVVLGELQTSSQAIERLVQRCWDELDHPVQGAVVLELHPQDKEMLQHQASEFIRGMRLEAMPDMPRGSVRLFANDTVIEDLVTHRLESLAQALLCDVPAWRETSALMQPAAAASTEPETNEVVENNDVHS